MRQRPWPIIILAVFYCLAPLYNSMFSAWLMKISWFTYLRLHVHSVSLFTLLVYYGSFPLAGLAIYSFKKWSFPAYFSIMLWTLYQNYETHHKFPHIFGLGWLVVFYGLNLALVGYFLLRPVRRLYQDKSLRWWESLPRYPLQCPCSVDGPDGTTEARLEDISVGGCRIGLSRPGKLNEPIIVKFTEGGIDYAITGHVIYQREGTPTVAGISFEPDETNKKNLKKLVKSLRKSGLEPRNKADLSWTSLRNWAVHAVKTGEGLTPQTEREAIKRSG